MSYKTVREVTQEGKKEGFPWVIETYYEEVDFRAVSKEELAAVEGIAGDIFQLFAELVQKAEFGGDGLIPVTLTIRPASWYRTRIDEGKK